MPRSITFTIDGQPKALARHRTTRSGHTYDPQSNKDAKKRVVDAAKAVMFASRMESPLQGPIKLDVTFYMKRPKATPVTETWCIKRPDLDNMEKLLNDALQGVLFDDDSQVCVINSSKLYALFDPCTVVSYSEIGE